MKISRAKKNRGMAVIVIVANLMLFVTDGLTVRF